MGTNFYWKKTIPTEENVRKWQKDFKKEFESLLSESGEEIHKIAEKFILDNNESIYKEECDLLAQERQEEYKRHIGKRSSAGPYCWDCGKTLCKGGEGSIHTGSLSSYGSGWWKICPSCGKEPSKNSNSISNCCSFTWAENPEKFFFKSKVYVKEDKLIVDEYDREFTCQEFIDMLDSECPIRFTELIGREFC